MQARTARVTLRKCVRRPGASGNSRPGRKREKCGESHSRAADGTDRRRFGERCRVARGDSEPARHHFVPFGARSVTDIMARIIADDLGRRWNQQVIVENRPGLPGTVAVAKAAPDGYTLMLTSNGHTVTGLVDKNLNFDPVKDFSGITRVCTSPLMLITHPDVPAKSVKDLLELAKSKPGTLNFSSAGLASTTFIAGAQFRKAAGINIQHVPFRSAPDAVTAVVRGDAQLYFAPVNLSKGWLRAER